MFKILSKARNRVSGSYWLSSGTYTLLTKGLVTVFAFVNFYILIRVFTPIDFGAWVLFTSVSSFMELIKHGFVRNPLLYFLGNADENDHPRIQTASLYLNAIFGFVEVFLLIACAYALSSFWELPQLKPLFFIYVLTTFALIPLNHLDIIQQSHMHFKGTFYSNLVRQVGLFIYMLALYGYGLSVGLTSEGFKEFLDTHGLNSLALVQFAFVVLSGLVSYHYAKPFIKYAKSVHWKTIWELFHYGKFTFGTNVSSTILKNIDSWMLARMISPAAVTIFNPAIRMSNLVEVPTVTLQSILFPQLLKRMKEEGLGAAKYLYEKSVATITAVMFPVVFGIILLAKPVVLFIAGAGFEETVPILQITMLYGLIIPFNRLFGITLDAIGMAKQNFKFVFRNAFINAISNFFYIHYFGIIGAAYGTMTTYIFVLVHNQYYLRRHLNISIGMVFRHFIGFYVTIFSTGLKWVRKS